MAVVVVEVRTKVFSPTTFIQDASDTLNYLTATTFVLSGAAGPSAGQPGEDGQNGVSADVNR